MPQSEIEKTLEEMHKYIEDAMTKYNLDRNYNISSTAHSNKSILSFDLPFPERKPRSSYPLSSISKNNISFDDFITFNLIETSILDSYIDGRKVDLILEDYMGDYDEFENSKRSLMYRLKCTKLIYRNFQPSYVTVIGGEKYIKLDTGLSKNNITLERLVNNG